MNASITATPISLSLAYYRKTVRNHRKQDGRRYIHRVRVLSNFGGAGSEDVGRVEFRVHAISLAGIDHEEYFVISIQEQSFSR